MSKFLQQVQKQNEFLDTLKLIRSQFNQSLYPMLSAALGSFERLNQSLVPGGDYEAFASTWEALLAGDAGELAPAQEKIESILGQMQQLKQALEEFEMLRPGILDILPQADVPPEDQPTGEV